MSEPPLHFFVAGTVAVGMSCVLLMDEVEQEDTQLCIQYVAATMSAIISVNQEQIDESG